MGAQITVGPGASGWLSPDTPAASWLRVREAAGVCRRPVSRRPKMSEVQISGDLPCIIKNEDRVNDGDLVSYCQVLFFNANNLNNPYHNFRHMSHVLWLCHDACRYYQNELPPGRMRVLLVAAMFHDFDHPGHPHPGEHDPDRINIPIAIAGLRRFAMAEDRVLLPEIEAMIEATHYP